MFRSQIFTWSLFGVGIFSWIDLHQNGSSPLAIGCNRKSHLPLYTYIEACSTCGVGLLQLFGAKRPGNFHGSLMLMFQRPFRQASGNVSRLPLKCISIRTFYWDNDSYLHRCWSLRWICYLAYIHIGICFAWIIWRIQSSISKGPANSWVRRHTWNVLVLWQRTRKGLVAPCVDAAHPTVPDKPRIHTHIHINWPSDNGI